MTLQLNPIFHDLSHRNELGAFLNARGLTGKVVEVGTLYGAFAAEILREWKGQLFCVDPWVNQDPAKYFDGANSADMDQVFAVFQNDIGKHERCTGLRMMSLNAVGKFEDGELAAVYLDGNHRLSNIRDDIAAWIPKVKIGGIICGHDFFTRYDKDTDSDALTAVMELAEAVGVRPHVTWDSSWYFEKTEEFDAAFRRACVEGSLPRPVYSDNSASENCVVVIPVAKFDWNLACKLLRWWNAMLGGEGNKFWTVALCSPELTADEREALIDSDLSNLSVMVAENIVEAGYFGGTPNQMMGASLDLMEKTFPAYPMLWVEADCVPMTGNWIDLIMAEYRFCDRPFMGDVQREGGIPHLTGVAVYPPNARKYAPLLATIGRNPCGWDSLAAADILPRSHYAKTIQQVWRPPLPITDAWAKANIRPETALFHQCKDGSLIDVLCLRDGLPLIPLAPALCESTYEKDRHKLAPTGPTGAVVTKGSGKRAGGVEIMVTACRRDAEFFGYCLKSIELFARGFAGITLVVPVKDAKYFQKFDRRVKLTTFDEHPTKGFLHHEIMVLRADELCPHADYILHLDPDVLFWKATTPEDLVKNGRCLMVRERYDEIASRNPNRLIWRKCVEAATGIMPEFETMVRHPNIYPRALYGRIRALVEMHTGQGFDQYVLSCENGFPQSFCEYCTAGAVAIRDMPEKFNFVEYDHARDARELLGLPERTGFQYVYRLERDHFVEFWSHSGVSRYKTVIDSILVGKPPAFYLK